MLLLTRAAHKHKLTQLHLLLFEDARKHRNECSPWMRMPKSRQTGVCVRHGAGWRKYANICSANECTNLANEYAIMISMEQGQAQRNVAVKDVRILSSEEESAWRWSMGQFWRRVGWSNQAQKGRVYFKLGAKIKLCTTDQAEREGVCCRHGAKCKMFSSEGCTNLVV